MIEEDEEEDGDDEGDEDEDEDEDEVKADADSLLMPPPHQPLNHAVKQKGADTTQSNGKVEDSEDNGKVDENNAVGSQKLKCLLMNSVEAFKENGAALIQSKKSFLFVKLIVRNVPAP